VVAVGATCTEPLVAVLLVQVALHELALVAAQVSVDEAPLLIVAGVAVNVTAGAWSTVTVAIAVAEPAVFEHCSVKVVVAVTDSFALPDRPSLPVQPPLAAQLVALVLLQVSIDVPPPALRVDGVALIVTVGSGTVLTTSVAEAVAVPPGPVQVSV
jgi:hypothetical protein